MADDSRSTLSPSYVWFAEHGERELDVVDFSVDESMSTLFSLVVRASTQNGKLTPSSFIGKGAAFRFLHHAGDLVWAGICSEASQVSNQPDGAVTVSTYEFTIVPALWRTTLRRNNRVFQRMTVKQIVEKILAEWELPHRFDLKEVHQTHDYRVQYHESDFAFMTRLLEEEGISYWFDHAIKSGPGSEVTSIVFSDQPQVRPPLPGKLPYRAGGETFVDGENVIFDVRIATHMTFGKATNRDFDFRLRPDMELIQTASGVGAQAPELVYEDYRYRPGAFSALPGTGDPLPIADDKGPVRTVDAQRKARTERDVGADRHGRVAISFSTTALELTNGDVFAIGQNSTEVHPNPQVPKTRNLLAISRHVVGSTRGIAHQEIEAVPIDFPHRPPRRTPKPRILGVQSALVVGPKQQEIHVDEMGRVRVQFHWDREGGYDDESSCWMRVSQAWAGNKFGIIALPRVGHEVLVGFYEGDPDQPVVVGRIYNRTNAVPYELAKSKTKSGWRTESSGGDRSEAARGYHELTFEDAIGKEQVFMRSEGSLATIVHENESRDVGGSRSTAIGAAEVVHIGKTSLTLVGDKTGFMMSEGGPTPSIILSTTGASVQIVGGNIIFDAKGEIHFHGGTQVQISSETGSITVKGKTSADFDCAGSKSPEPAASKVPAASGPSGGPTLPAPTYPAGAKTKLPPPKGFEEAKVKNAKDAAPPPPPPPRKPRGPTDDGESSTSSPTATTTPANATSAATSKTGGSAMKDMLSHGIQQLASGASPLDVAKSAGIGAISKAAGPVAGEALSRGLQMAAGASPFDVVKSLAMGELQQAFVKAEMAALPTQSVAKVNAIAQQVVGFVDLKDKSMSLLKGLF